MIFVGIFLGCSLFPEGQHLVLCSVLLHIFLHLERILFFVSNTIGHRPSLRQSFQGLLGSYFKIIFLSCNWELTIHTLICMDYFNYLCFSPDVSEPLSKHVVPRVKMWSEWVIQWNIYWGYNFLWVSSEKHAFIKWVPKKDYGFYWNS